MSNYTENFMSNASRMIGFTMGGTNVYLDHLRFLTTMADMSDLDREYFTNAIDKMEMRHKTLCLWWEKRGEENVDLDSLEAEILGKQVETSDIVELERA